MPEFSPVTGAQAYVRLSEIGCNDVQVIQLNRAALARVRCEKQIVIVPGATHLFEEPGALDEVARLAREWLQRRLIRAAQRAAWMSR